MATVPSLASVLRQFFRKNGYRQVRSPSRTATKLGRIRPLLPTGRPTKFGSRRSGGRASSRRLGTSDHVILPWPGHRKINISSNSKRCESSALYGRIMTFLAEFHFHGSVSAEFHFRGIPFPRSSISAVPFRPWPAWPGPWPTWALLLST